jgi:hypothetical protein
VAKVVALGIVGFCKVEVNEFIPVHVYETPPLLDKFRVEPAQIGLLLLAVAVGKGFITTDVVAVAVAVQPLFITTTR